LYLQNTTGNTIYSSVLVSDASLNSSSGRQKLEKYAFRTSELELYLQMICEEVE
jgi:hypothetical protein